jgi:Mg-chelatase subunit ChlD
MYSTTQATAGSGPSQQLDPSAVSAKRLRTSARRQQELEAAVNPYTSADADVVLSDRVDTAFVTTQNALYEHPDDFKDIIGQQRLQQVRSRVTGDYVMFIRTDPADTTYLPTSDQKVADRIMQFGLAFHELGHVLYTDIEKTSAIIENRIDEPYQGLVGNILHNSTEDVRIEHLLREDLGREAELKQRGTHQIMRSPVEDIAPRTDYTLMQAIQGVFIDEGLYDRGVVEAALDTSDDRVQFADTEDETVFRDLYPDLQDLLAAVKTDSSVEALHRVIDFWEAKIKPHIDVPDTQSGSGAGIGGDLGDVLDDIDEIIVGNGPLPQPEDLDGVTVVVTPTPSDGQESDSAGEDIVVKTQAGQEDNSDSTDDEEASRPSTEDLEDGQATLDDFAASASESADGDADDADDAACDDTDGAGVSDTDGAPPGLDGDGLDDAQVDELETAVEAEAEAIVAVPEEAATEGHELEETVDDIESDELEDLTVVPEPDQYQAARAGRLEHLTEEADGLADSLAIIFEDNDRTGFDAPYATGERFDDRSAWRVPLGHPDILGSPARPDEKEYDILIVLDRSASMREMIAGAEDAVAMFALACRGLGLNVSIMDFVETEPRIVAPFRMPLETVSPTLLSEDAGGGTPLGDVLEVARTRMKHRPFNNTGLILIVTDGEPDNDQQAKYHDQLESARVPVAGLTLLADQNSGAIPDEVRANEQYFDSHEYVWSMDALTDALDSLAAAFSGFF